MDGHAEKTCWLYYTSLNCLYKESGFLKKVLKSWLNWMEVHSGKSGALTGWLQQAISAGIALLMVPLLTSFLSAEESGLWFAFQGMVAMAGLANFGIGHVVSRQTAFCLGVRADGVRDDFLDFGQGSLGVSRLNTYASRVYMWITFCSVLIGIIIFEGVIPHTRLLPGAPSEYRFIWYLMLGSSLFLIMGSRYVSFLLGSGLTHIVKILATLNALFQGMGIFVAVWFSSDLVLMAGVSCILALIYFFILRQVTKLCVIGLRCANYKGVIDKGVMRRMIGISFPLGVVNIGSFLFSNIQSPLVGALLGSAMVTPFYLAQKLVQFVVLGCQQSLQPQLPKFTRLVASMDWLAAVSLMKRSFKVYVPLVILAALGFTLGGPVILGYLTSDIATLPMNVIYVMGVDLIVLAITVAMTHFVLASGRNPFMIPSLLGGGLNLILILVLVPYLGLVALPLSTLISGLITSYYAGFFYWHRLWRQMKAKLVR